MTFSNTVKRPKEMTIENAPKRNRRLKSRSVTIFLVTLLFVGNPVEGLSQTDFTEKQYQMFRSFYYDSWNTIFEVVGHDPMTSLSEFGNTSPGILRDLCRIIVDYSLFRSTAVGIFIDKSFGIESMDNLILRLMFDLAKVNWIPIDEVKSKDEPKLLQAKDDLEKFVKENYNYLNKNHAYCVDIVRYELKSSYQLIQNHSSIKMEFQLRDFYESQIPFLKWVLENTVESEEKNELQKLIESIERKYLL